MTVTMHAKVTCPSIWREYINRLPAYYLLSYSRHALDRARERGLRLPRELGSSEVVEMTLANRGNILKLLVRIPYGSNHYLCLSLTPSGHIITCYLNRVGDEHATLDRTRYLVDWN
jgi:hypothetical protein